MHLPSSLKKSLCSFAKWLIIVVNDPLLLDMFHSFLVHFLHTKRDLSRAIFKCRYTAAYLPLPPGQSFIYIWPPSTISTSLVASVAAYKVGTSLVTFFVAIERTNQTKQNKTKPDKNLNKTYFKSNFKLKPNIK